MSSSNPDILGEEIVTQLPESRQAGSRPSASFLLSIVDGPDTGQSHLIDGSEPSPTLLGQSSVCAIALKDPRVSRRHATLEVQRDRLHLKDLGSTNGTFVAGIDTVEAFLHGGETIRVGDTAIRVERRAAAHNPVPLRTHFGRLIGASYAMRRLYPLIERLAAVDVPVIIEGETGTGKELLAEALHEAGPRAAAPFVVLDCTTIPANLVESELLGHERGAFTGATSSRMGLFEAAHGGTLFIDEIGDLDLALQPKLLRAIERKEFKRVGGNKSIAVDVRVLAATRRNLDEEVREGRFRDDLFHRLTVARIELPPLRARAGDIALLARHFWRASGGDLQELPELLISRWEAAPWPGNVRELRNTVARHCALGALVNMYDQDQLSTSQSADAGHDPIERVLALGMPLSQARQLIIEEFERRYVQRVLDEHGGNVGRASAAAGIARRYFQILRARSK